MKTTRTTTIVGRDQKLQSLVKGREARAKQNTAYQQLQNADGTGQKKL